MTNPNDQTEADRQREIARLQAELAAAQERQALANEIEGRLIAQQFNESNGR